MVSELGVWLCKPTQTSFQDKCNHLYCDFSLVWAWTSVWTLLSWASDRVSCPSSSPGLFLGGHRDAGPLPCHHYPCFFLKRRWEPARSASLSSSPIYVSDMLKALHCWPLWRRQISAIQGCIHIMVINTPRLEEICLSNDPLSFPFDMWSGMATVPFVHFAQITSERSSWGKTGSVISRLLQNFHQFGSH